MQRRIPALGPRFGQVLGPQQRLLRLPEVAIWEIFELLGRLVTYMYSSYQVKTTTWINLYRYLGIYAKKDSSAWTEVWSGALPSTAPITAPGVLDVRGNRNFQKADRIFVPACNSHLPHQNQTHTKIGSIAQGNKGTPFDTCIMQ